MSDNSHDQPNEIDRLLRETSKNSKNDWNHLYTLIYEDLYRIARYSLRRDPTGPFQDPGELVNEAFIRFIELPESISWRDHAHFFAWARLVMRRILVDEQRRRPDAKVKFPLNVISESSGELSEVMALNQALERLRKLDEQQANIIDLISFAGQTVEETATQLGISKSTVYAQLKHAKTWLHNELDAKPSLREKPERGSIDFTLTFDSMLSPDQIKETLRALADYYRVCGGAGFQVDPELEDVLVWEPIYV